MSEYILRLDDACERRDVGKWNRMEETLDKYGIKPLVGVIPHCEDPMMEQYSEDKQFWERVKTWESKGWTIALHGYNHVYSTHAGGINPVNRNSEFAGEPLDVQKEKIHKGVDVLRNHEIEPEVFFAPSHTFDLNTIEALKCESNIRIISDTISNKPYRKYGMTFVPQQSGRARKLPFHTVTFCYHPNTMTEQDFAFLESFLDAHMNRFTCFPMTEVKNRRGFVGIIIKWLYFLKRVF